jgi:hypothetical protein
MCLAPNTERGKLEVTQPVTFKPIRVPSSLVIYPIEENPTGDLYHQSLVAQGIHWFQEGGATRRYPSGAKCDREQHDSCANDG